MAALVPFRLESVQGFPDFLPVCIARGAGEVAESLQDISGFDRGSQSNLVWRQGEPCVLLCPVPRAVADQGLCASHGHSPPAGAAGSALDEPGTALVVIEVLGHTLAVLCFRAHLGCKAPERDKTEPSVTLGVAFGQSGAHVCACVSKACRAACKNIPREKASTEIRLKDN